MDRVSLTGRAEGAEADGSTESFNGIENKFTFLKLTHGPILAWLRHVYVPHPLYHESVISSIYYDTPSFDHYDEKLNSDFLKTKIRLRWYEKPRQENDCSRTRCFLEVKQKVGAARCKKRLEFTLDTDILRSDSLSAEELRRLPERLSEIFYTPDVRLMPMVLIRYTRHRFMDPRTGCSVTVDTEISCDQVNLRYVPAAHPVYLGNGVLEIKGSRANLLKSLLPISSALTRGSFSKYGTCLEILANPTMRSV